MTRKIYYSRWQFIYRCEMCERKLSHNEVLFSEGVCPYCGEITGCTILAAFREPFRHVYYSYWRYLLGIFPDSVEWGQREQEEEPSR